MSLGLLGKKIGMTRLFDQQAGIMIPVTVIDVSGNTILQSKTTEKDGYTAVQVGYGDQKEQRVIKPALGRFKKAGSTPKRFIQEFRFENGAALPEAHTGHGNLHRRPVGRRDRHFQGQGFPGCREAPRFRRSQA
jgi:large subunit ribosomal protein L3